MDPAADDEPLGAVPEHALEGADEEDDRRRETVGGESRQDPEGLTDVLGDGKVVELKLSEAHQGLEGIGVV